MKDKSKNKLKIKDKSLIKKINEIEIYKYISLEHCDINNLIKGREEDIFKTLKSFSDIEKFKAKNPHILHKDNKLKKYYDKCRLYSTDKLYSIDIEGRNSNYRMIYCKVKEDKAYQILSLCTDETH